MPFSNPLETVTDSSMNSIDLLDKLLECDDNDAFCAALNLDTSSSDTSFDWDFDDFEKNFLTEPPTSIPHSDETNIPKQLNRSSKISSSDRRRRYPRNCYPTPDSGVVTFDETEWVVVSRTSSKTRTPKLYEFLRLLLANPRYQSYASWINEEEGLFKLHKPQHVAQLWATIKMRQGKEIINYDSFTRGIRYYYTTKLMIKTCVPYRFRFATKK